MSTFILDLGSAWRRYHHHISQYYPQTFTCDSKQPEIDLKQLKIDLKQPKIDPKQSEIDISIDSILLMKPMAAIGFWVVSS